MAIETEQSLNKAKGHIEELSKELVFVNNNRKDLETAIHGLQEQNQMLNRELQTLRVQFGGGPAPSVGNSLSKMRAQSSREQPPPLYPREMPPQSSRSIPQIYRQSSVNEQPEYQAIN